MTGRRSIDDLEATTHRTMQEFRASIAEVMLAADMHEAAAEELFAAIAERRAEWLRDRDAGDV